MPRHSRFPLHLTTDPSASTLRNPVPMADGATKPCDRCGTPNPGGANFCFHCGWPFGRAPLAPPPVAEPAPEEDWSALTERIEVSSEQTAEDLRARLDELAK